MNISRAFVIGCLLLGAALTPPRASAQSTKLVVSEGKSIGYATVADARAAVESEGLTAMPGSNGAVSFVEPDNGTAWTFAGRDDPAYPSVVRYVYTKSVGVLQAEISILCEASAGHCEKFRSDIRDHLAQLSKKMAGDPSADCAVNERTMTCGAEAERKP